MTHMRLNHRYDWRIGAEGISRRGAQARADGLLTARELSERIGFSVAAIRRWVPRREWHHLIDARGAMRRVSFYSIDDVYNPDDATVLACLYCDGEYVAYRREVALAMRTGDHAREQQLCWRLEQQVGTYPRSLQETDL